MKPRVIDLTRHLPSPVQAAMADAFDLVPPNDPGALAVVVTVDRRLDAALIASLPDAVRTIAPYSVGTDHIYLDVA